MRVDRYIWLGLHTNGKDGRSLANGRNLRVRGLTETVNMSFGLLDAIAMRV